MGKLNRPLTLVLVTIFLVLSLTKLFAAGTPDYAVPPSEDYPSGQFIGVTGGYINSANVDKVEIYGYSATNSSVDIIVEGQTIGQVNTGEDGYFTQQFDLSMLDEGNVLIQAVYGTDPALSLNIIKDTQSPNITSLAVSIKEVENKQNEGIVPIITGSLPPGFGSDWNRILITEDTHNLQMEAIVDTNANQWWTRPNIPLENGTYNLKAVAIDKAGNKTQEIPIKLIITDSGAVIQ